LFRVSHSDKKSEQLITNLSTLKYKPTGSLLSTTQNMGMGSNQFGTIKRSTPKQKDSSDRPSTAPSKGDNENETSKKLNENNSLKRLPSPNLKSMSYFLINKLATTKGNKPLSMGNYGKRQPSPQTKSIGLSASFKPISGKNNFR